MRRALSRLQTRLMERFRSVPPLGLVVLTVTVVILVAGAGFGTYQTYDYIQHDNDFCVSCHLMQEPFDRFEASTHRDLGCKACHQPTPVDRTKMALRQIFAHPEEITAHAHVPNTRCESCHVEGDADEWLLVINSRGHEMHLNSMDPVLRDLECVTCHSADVHAFRATAASCSQRGCHSNVAVRLEGMEHLEVACLSCHDFLAPQDTDPGLDDPASLSPTADQCLGCHDMREKVDFDIEADPHGLECGICHDGHMQRAAVDAMASCTESLCHAVPQKVDDDHHRWPSIRLSDCTQCHQAHTFEVDGDNCAGCHTGIVAAGPEVGGSHGAAAPYVDFANRGVLGSFLGLGVSWGATRHGAAGAAPSTAQARPFDHDRHRSVECRTCHTTGTSVVRNDAGWCSSCHHNPSRGENSCSRCHRSGGPSEVTFEVVMDLPGGEEARELTFPHEGHSSTSCAECHGSPAGPVAQDFTCLSCHQEHHEAEEVDCLQCHVPPARWAHMESVVHRTCSGGICHSGVGEGFAEEWPASLCIACHQDFRNGEIPALPAAPPDTLRWPPWAADPQDSVQVSGIPPQRHP